MRKFRRSRLGRTSSLLILVLLFLAMAVVFAGAYYVGTRRSSAVEQAARDTLLAATGLQRPVTNRLDPRFTDADGDLVADAPKSEKDFIDPPTLNFCYVAVDEPEQFKVAWADFTKHLSEVTGKPVEYMLLDSEDDELRALREGRLHVAGLNTGRVPIAVDTCGFVPVAMLAGADGVGGRNHTEIIVPADSAVHDVRELKGRELTLTDAGSNSGYKAPLVFLKEFNLLPARDYQLRYSGGHDQSIAGIASHRYQAAAVSSDVLQRSTGAGTIKKDQYRSIFKSESFPTAGLGYVYNLKPELAQKIRDALLKYSWKGTSMEKYFIESGQTGLAPVNYKEDWSLVRRVDDAIGYEHVLK